jgi:hypothetical protein
MIFAQRRDGSRSTDRRETTALKVEVAPIPCADFERLRSETMDCALLMSMCIATGQRERLRAYDVKVDGQGVGRLIGVREPFRYQVRFGPLKLFKWRTQRIRIIGEYGVVGHSGADLLTTAVAELVRMEHSVTLQAIPSDSPLYEAARALRELSAVHVRPCYAYARLAAGAHRKCDDKKRDAARHRLVTGGDFETYLKSLSKSTRQTFRQTLRKLHQSHAIELRVYERPEAVEEFVASAGTVARTTYQQKRLGLGFTDAEGVTRRVRLAAENGWLRSFVLFCDGQPAAYVEGYQGGGRWFTFQIGHDPKWSSLSLGTACQLEVVRYLIESADRPRIIDYLEGDMDYKRRLCNVHVTETTIEVTDRASSVSLLPRMQAILDGAYRFVRALLISIGWRRKRGSRASAPRKGSCSQDGF